MLEALIEQVIDSSFENQVIAILHIGLFRKLWLPVKRVGVSAVAYIVEYGYRQYGLSDDVDHNLVFTHQSCRVRGIIIGDGANDILCCVGISKYGYHINRSLKSKETFVRCSALAVNPSFT